MGRNTPRSIGEEGVWDINDLEEKVVRPNQWGRIGAKTFAAFSVTHTSLPPGCYTINWDNNQDRPLYLEKTLKTDTILSFKGGLTQRFLGEIDDFWKREEAFRDNGFLHRRGYLLYGTQGTGKSSIVWQVAKDVVDRGGIVFVCDNPKFFAKGLSVFRDVETKRPIVCVFEDIDAIISKYGESEILSLLDGDSQIDRVINIATTNYPEKLDKRIVSRPRRFDRVYKIEVPSDAVRTAFLKAKLPNKADQKEWIKKTKGLSFAALTEALISVLCLGNSLSDTVKILKDIEGKTPQLADFGNGTVGFGKEQPESDDDD